MRSQFCKLCLVFLFITVSGCQPKPDPVPPALPEPPEVVEPVEEVSPLPTVSLLATPGTIDLGEQTTLSWNSENGTSLVIDNGIGNVRPSGEIVVSPSQSTTYTAIVMGPGGEARASSRVTVLEARTDDVVKPDAEVLRDLIRQNKVKLVFFAYDKAQLSAGAKATLQQNALIFREYPNVKLIVEGHCDERGSEEYNLALGDRRAIAVRDYLSQLGVKPGRMQSVSFGEERPADTRGNEEAFARNRRAEFSLP